MRVVSPKTPAAVPRGFTLIEVVIAVALVSLVMLGLVSAMSTFGMTAAKLEERVDRGTQSRLVTDFLRGALSSAIKHKKQLLPDGGRHVYFHGTTGELLWLGNMPARHGVGGLHHFRLTVMEDSTSTFLALQYAPYLGESRMPDWSLLPPHVLVERVNALRMTYQSKPRSADEEVEWFDVWDSAELLPGRVRIDIDVEGQHWPPLFVTLNSTDAAGGGIRIVHGPVE